MGECKKYTKINELQYVSLPHLVIWKLKGFTLVEGGPPAEAAPCIADLGLEIPCAGSATNINQETKPKQPT